MGKVKTEKEVFGLGERISEHELCPDELLKGQEEAFQRDIDRLQTRLAEFVKVACPACSKDRHSRAFDKHGFTYVTCDHCATLFMNPRPSPEVMAAYYSDSENYQYWAKHIFPSSEEARRRKIHEPWLERVIGYCHEFSVSKGVLIEVGAGYGTFCSVARDSGEFTRVIAVEPTPEMAQACRKRDLYVIDKRIEDITAADVVPADVVVSFEVIEHLFEPRQFLSQCTRIVKPGGLLVVSCPNGKGFDIAMLGSLSLAIDPEHINLFNPDALTLLMEDCGFQVLEVNTPGRLDAEFVHEAIQKGIFEISKDPFLQRVLVDEWDSLGWPFQQFLAQNGLSSHMWLAAIRK